MRAIQVILGLMIGNDDFENKMRIQGLLASLVCVAFIYFGLGYGSSLLERFLTLLVQLSLWVVFTYLFTLAAQINQRISAQDNED